MPVKFAALFVLAFGFVETVLAQSCEFLPEAPQPAWTYDDPAIEGYYVGVGLAEESDGGADAQIELARRQAVADLAAGIETSVKSRLSVAIRERGAGDDADVDRDVQALTETITETSLEQVENDATWLDRERCIVWVRVKLKRSVIEARQRRELAVRKQALLDKLYDQARNKKNPLNERSSALEQAEIVLEEIDFTALKGVTSKRYYQRLLGSLRRQLGASVGAADVLKRLRDDAEQLWLAAGQATDANTRKQKTAQAIGKLKQIVAEAPLGASDGEAGEAALFKIAEIEQARNNSCEARLQYEIVRDRSASADWRERAAAQATQQKCSKAKRKKQVWRRNFDAVPTKLLCASEINGQAQDWDKPCDSLRSFLDGHGALKAAGVLPASKELLSLADRLKRDSASAAKLGKSGRAILLVARGKTRERSNAKNPLGNDHQFSGRIATYVVNNGQLEFADQYTGTGGWNPVSAEMAVEVLGLNVAKRWKQKYLNHIRNQ